MQIVRGPCLENGHFQCRKMHVNHVYDSIYPTLVTTCLFGLNAVYLISDNRKLRIIDFLKVLTISYLLLFTFILYLGVTTPRITRHISHYTSGVSLIGVYFQFLSQILITYVAFLFNLFHNGKLKQVMEDIAKIDGKFADLGVKIQHFEHFRYEFLVTIAGIFTILIRCISNYFYVVIKFIPMNDYIYLTIVWPSFILFLVQTQFTMLVKLINERYSLINRNLAAMTPQVSAKIDYVKVKPIYYNEFIRMNNPPRKLDLLMEIHDGLGDVGMKLNSCFTVQILISLATQFLGLLFSVFYLYYECLVVRNYVAAFNWLGVILTTILEILHITVTCHLTSSQARNTGVEIHKVLMDEKDPKLKRRLMIFSQQVYHKPLEFSACGLFTIDATLLFTFCGAAATYLLIMLQFQEGIEAQCASNKTIL